MKDKDKQPELDSFSERTFKSIDEEKEIARSRKLVCPIVDFRDLRMIMGLSYSSRGLEKIKVRPGRIYPDGKLVEGNLRVLNRPQIHVFVQASKGSFKSAHARALKEAFPDTVVSQDYVTGAGLRGSITDEGKFVPPLLFNWALKCVLMDEVVKDRHGETTRMMLQMLEGNHYIYKLGRKIENMNSRTMNFANPDGSFTSGEEIYQKTGAMYTVTDSNVEVYAPFTCIMLSMYPLTFTLSSQLGQALLDRMLVASYEIHDDQRDDVEDGMYKFEFPVFNPPSTVEISAEEYIKIKEMRNKKLTNKDPEFSKTRILDNMLRAYAVVKDKLAIDSGELDAIFDLITKVSGAYWVETASPRKHNR
jgi:hypothetical protein